VWSLLFRIYVQKRIVKFFGIFGEVSAVFWNTTKYVSCISWYLNVTSMSGNIDRLFFLRNVLILNNMTYLGNVGSRVNTFSICLLEV